MNVIAKISSGVLFLCLAGAAIGQTSAAPPTDPGSSAPQATPAVGTKAHADAYVIGNDDHLAISVWKEPDLTRSIPVRSDGKISLPLIGEIEASGRTPLQLESDI